MASFKLRSPQTSPLLVVVTPRPALGPKKTNLGDSVARVSK